jgi:exonuclease III
MKLISLNIWGGRAYEPLMEFLQGHAEDIDIFCFQEVLRTPTNRIAVEDGKHNIRLNIYDEIKKILPEHVAYFAGSEDNYIGGGPTDFLLEYGLAMFIKKSLTVTAVDDIFIHKHRGAARSETGRSAARTLQYASLSQNKKEYTILNYHGLHTGEVKDDTEDRLAQSKKIHDILINAHGPKILCGDLNLLPDTESMAILEDGMRNLIKENDITSTRSSFYKKEERFADYILVSEKVDVKKFSVLPDEASDHLAMYLEFN